MYVEVCGLGPSSSLPTGGWEHAQVTIERDGRISATTGASPHGQGNETTFAQMLADQFGVPIEHITILHGDTGVVKQGIGTFGSRSQAVGGTALHLAGGKVKAKMAKFAAALLEAHEDDIVFENGTIGVKGVAGLGEVVRGSRGVRLRAGAAARRASSPGLSDEAFFEPTNNTYPFGCHISMLEIDRETGEPTLLKLVAVDDAGNLINPLIVEGQIHGGLAQGIGQAMIEEAVYNEDGQLLTGSFMDYALPRATDFPRFELHATVTPTPVNPLGAKGVGEAGTLGSTPCIVNAAVDALSGVRREAHRHDAAARKAVAHHPGRPGVIPTAFDYARATSLDDALAKLQAAGGGGKLIAGGHSLVPLMKLRLSEPQVAHRHRAHPGPARHPRAGRQDRDRRRHGAPRRRDVGAAAGQVSRSSPKPRRDRRPAGAQPRHARRQPRARGSVGRLSGGDAGARRRDPPEGRDGLARTVKATDFFQDLFTVDLRGRRDHRGVAVHAGAGGGLRQAAPARVALRHRRRRGGARGAAAARSQSARIGLTGATSHAARLTASSRRSPGRRRRTRRSTRAARLGRRGTSTTSTRTSTPARTIAARWFRCSRDARCRRRWRARSSAARSSARLAFTAGTRRNGRASSSTRRRCRRWPSRAIAPPVCTVPRTSTIVVAPSGAQRDRGAALHESRSPLPFASSR